MMTATIEFSLDELTAIREIFHRQGVTGPLLELVDTEIEKLELVDMSDWNDCGDACKL